MTSPFTSSSICDAKALAFASFSAATPSTLVPRHFPWSCEAPPCLHARSVPVTKKAAIHGRTTSASLRDLSHRERGDHLVRESPDGVGVVHARQARRPFAEQEPRAEDAVVEAQGCRAEL